MQKHGEAPEKMLEALTEFGFESDCLTKVNADTQVVSDLGIWGDDFGDFYEIVSRIYGTAYLVPAECVPSEFAWQKTVKGWLPFTKLKDAVPCASLTLFEFDCIMRGNSHEI